MSEPTDDVAETLFENRSDPRTYRLTLDDERAFEVTTADFEYDPADEYGDGDFRQVIEFRDAPDLDLDDNRYATQQGEIDTVVRFGRPATATLGNAGAARRGPTRRRRRVDGPHPALVRNGMWRKHTFGTTYRWGFRPTACVTDGRDSPAVNGAD